jgi:hypothetical protein
MLAYDDPKFLDSDEARPVRILAEYLAPLRAFREAQVHGTVVFFGSARARAGGPVERYVEQATELARLAGSAEAAAIVRKIARRPGSGRRRR